MSKRTAEIKRETTETQIDLKLDLDGTGKYEIATGSGFFDHMLSHLAKHSRSDLQLQAKGDLHVDAHHTVEDVGICLGQAIDQALGDKKGIIRFGEGTVPMEDSLARVAIDLCGRASFVFNVKFPGDKIGDFDVELVAEFLRSLANNAKMNLHVNVPYGENNHHIAEAIFKALGRSLAEAKRIDDQNQDVPSTKGVL
ncbi:MAG: imidazoleglycerol-phosphate dehydratase HisB [Sedimentisphaerales bacterium]|nr:imidazoleglycerol-phosphate dehydratase HisB [Sedimentisphaerales bacterium]